MLTSLRFIHSVWRQQTYVSEAVVVSYKDSIAKFTVAWKALGWAGTVWVHWVIAHSGYLLQTHRSLYLFSSIPTEHKHKAFKVDMRHTFHGRSHKRPRVSAAGILHAVNNHALDVGLQLLKHSGGPDRKKRRL